ncbi:MAG: DUF4386 domain-containing protein [Ignavibacteriales bacterium]|nr:DUF4386 domain-containing protein [Ignavibacteriales bacterium]
MESIKNIIKITAVGYLIIFLTGFFSNFFVLENLIVSGNSAATLNNIIENELLFRWSIVSFILMVIFDLLLAWTLYLLLKEVNQKLSLLSAWLRLVNATIFGLALYNLVSVLQLTVNPEYSKLLELGQLQAQVMLNLGAFNNIWLIGLIFFGLHLLLVGYLIIQSGFIPKLLGVLLFVAGIGYLVDSFANFLLPNYSNYKDIFEIVVILPGVIGEFSFTIWLLSKGFFSKKKQLVIKSTKRSLTEEF